MGKSPMVKKAKFGYGMLKKPDKLSRQKLEKSHNTKKCIGSLSFLKTQFDAI